MVFHGIVAELVDALDLGSSAFGVRVRFPPFPPELIAAKSMFSTPVAELVYAGDLKSLHYGFESRSA